MFYFSSMFCLLESLLLVFVSSDFTLVLANKQESHSGSYHSKWGVRTNVLLSAISLWTLDLGSGHCEPKSYYSKIPKCFVQIWNWEALDCIPKLAFNRKQCPRECSFLMDWHEQAMQTLHPCHMNEMTCCPPSRSWCQPHKKNQLAFSCFVKQRDQKQLGGKRI